MRLLLCFGCFSSAVNAKDKGREEEEEEERGVMTAASVVVMIGERRKRTAIKESITEEWKSERVERLTAFAGGGGGGQPILMMMMRMNQN